MGCCASRQVALTVDCAGLGELQAVALATGLLEAGARIQQQGVQARDLESDTILYDGTCSR